MENENKWGSGINHFVKHNKSFPEEGKTKTFFTTHRTMNQLIQLLLTLGLFQLVRSHGFMVNPPARNCMWRYGYGTPKNYDDNQLWCGGM